MFELLDDAQRKAVRKAIVKPRYLIFAAMSLLLIGVEVGILIGRRDWDLFDWLAGAGLNAFLLLSIFAPLFRELYRFLRNHEVDELGNLSAKVSQPAGRPSAPPV